MNTQLSKNIRALSRAMFHIVLLFFKFGGLYAVLNDSLTYINRHYELDLGLHCANVQSFAGCEMRIERNPV